jgi:hypothetical protein
MKASVRRTGPWPVIRVIQVDEDELVRVPILGTASAGNGHGVAHGPDADDVSGAYVYFDRREARGRELLAVEVTGTCMEPLLFAGDIVICEQVHSARQVPSGALCVAWVMDDDDVGGNVKYIDWQEETARLRGENGKTKVVPRERLHVQGRVLEMRRKL